LLLQIPGVLNPSEVDALRRELSSAPFEDGAVTAGPAARDVKRNLQVKQNSDAAKRCGAIVHEGLRRSSLFYSAALPLRVHGPLFNRYDTGMTYGEHTDNAIMGASVSVRSDLAATLFLSPPEEYDGGELTVHDSFGAHRVKLPAGSLILYAASSHHQVEPVTRGSRQAAVIWVQSMVRDQTRRLALFELDVSLGALRQREPGAPELATLTGLYHNLLRMWAEN
jgi:PKHD-type hydroxylase